MKNSILIVISFIFCAYLIWEFVNLISNNHIIGGIALLVGLMFGTIISELHYKKNKYGSAKTK
jgi:hypothetical protein